MKPKRRIWLHIGMHKTGSSSIQASFAGFASDALRCASLGSVNHSNTMVLLFGSRYDDPVQMVKKGWDETEKARLRAQANLMLDRELAIEERELLISGEDLCGMAPDQVRALRGRLLEAADEVRVLAYVRSPVGFMTSAFQQRVKGGMDWFRPAQPEYRNRFESYLQVFGPENVAFRAFEAATAGGRSVVADFTQWVGLAAASVAEVRANDGISAAAVAVLVAGNQRTRTWRRTRALVEARKALVHGLRLALPIEVHGKFRFGDAAAHAALDVADGAWMEQASGLSLMPPQPAKAGDTGGIDDLDDLMRLADRVRPEVARLAAAAGIQVAGDATAGELVELILLRKLALVGAEIRFRPVNDSNGRRAETRQFRKAVRA